jgi:type VI secretion system protein ImpC
MSTAGEAESQGSGASAEASGSLLDQITSVMPRAVEKPRRDELVRSLVEESLKGTVQFDKNISRTISNAIAAIDSVMSRQLAEILHHPDYQKLEGSWRGLHHLVMNSETGADLKIRVMNIGKRELFKDLDKAIEFDQSQIFKKIYEAEFGSPGGEPYATLIGDYEFTNHPEDIDLLSKMSQVGAAGFCPFITASAPELLGMESFTELSKPRDLEKIFLDESYTKWRSFRDSDDSRFVVLTMPRSLSRLPYGKNTKVVEEFDFEEVELDEKGNAKPVPHQHYAWMNTSYVLGTRLTDAHAKFGWCTAIRGAENGGKVEGLPAHVFTADDGDKDLKCPTEIAITDRREAELSKLGFLPLCHYKNTDYALHHGHVADRPLPEGDRPRQDRLIYGAAGLRGVAEAMDCQLRFDRSASFRRGQGSLPAGRGRD